MSFNVTEFTNDLLRDVNLTDDQKAALQSALGNDAVAKRLEEGQLRQSDYSRLSAEAQQKIRQANDYYNELVTWKQTESARNPASVSDPTPATDESYLSKTEFTAEINKIQSGAIGFLTVLNDKSMEYFQEFGKRLDTAAVLKKAQDEGTNFVIAYERFVQPGREEKFKAEIEARVKKEREEAVKEAMANMAMPTATNNTGLVGNFGTEQHVLDRLAAKPAEGFGWKAAAAAHTRDIMAGTVKHE